MKKYIAFALCALMLIPGCGTMSNTAKDSLIGAGGGAALGAVIGGLIGKDAKGAAIGAAIIDEQAFVVSIRLCQDAVETCRQVCGRVIDWDDDRD